MDADQSAGHSDVLITGAGESRSRVPRLLWIAFCVVVVLAVIATVARAEDRNSQHREFNSLLTASINGQATAQHADAVVESTRQYTMPLLGSAQPNVRAGLEQLIAQSASEGATQVEAIRERVASTSVLPWHRALHQAKAAELSYLDTWSAYLNSVAHGGDTGAIPTTVLAAKQTSASAALRDAAPDHTASLTIPASLAVIPSSL
ncbi:MAG TPA: hypothetical protein VK662_08900 [Acidothermaceae bacterium]|jgi:hypothetical protein|nr:hypothetical protein [Acidothermaceae bacterium]